MGLVGCGLIGSGWAAYLLAQGVRVRAWDPGAGVEMRLRTAIDRHAADLELSASEVDAWHAALSVHGTLQSALEGADFVQESGPEDADAKRRTFAEIDTRLDPSAIVASSSSALTMTPLQRGLEHPERFLLGHPFHPVTWMPLVEVSGGGRTSTRALAEATAFYRRIGKRPVRLRREIEGHIAGRLSAALYREAVHLVQIGVASVEDVDAAVMYGPGLRWSTVGPHLAYHLGGGAGGLEAYLDRLGDSQERRWATLGTPHLTADLRRLLVSEMERAVAASSVDDLAASRDRRLRRILEARVIDDDAVADDEAISFKDTLDGTDEAGD